MVPGTIALMTAEWKSGETGRRGNWLHIALSETFYQSAPTMPIKFSFVPSSFPGISMQNHISGNIIKEI